MQFSLTEEDEKSIYLLGLFVNKEVKGKNHKDWGQVRAHWPDKEPFPQKLESRSRNRASIDLVVLIMLELQTKLHKIYRNTKDTVMVGP